MDGWMDGKIDRWLDDQEDELWVRYIYIYIYRNLVGSYLYRGKKRSRKWKVFPVL
jgi:hypothetical protein